MNQNDILNAVAEAFGITGGFGNIINYAIGIAGGVAVGIIMYGGILYASSAGNESRQKDAKSWILAAITGLALLFGSYLLLNTINPAILRININLGTLSKPAAQPAPTYTSSVTPQFPTTGPYLNQCQGQCTSLGTLPTNGNLYCETQPGGCQISTTVYSDLLSLQSLTQGIPWVITGATPTGVNHLDKCHYIGTCVDIALTGNFSCSDLLKISQAAYDSGFQIQDNEYSQCKSLTLNNGTVFDYVNYEGRTTGGNLHISLPVSLGGSN